MGVTESLDLITGRLKNSRRDGMIVRRQFFGAWGRAICPSRSIPRSIRPANALEKIHIGRRK